MSWMDMVARLVNRDLNRIRQRRQIENAMHYGICVECGSPRELKIDRDHEDKPTAMGIVCPNGHPQ